MYNSCERTTRLLLASAVILAGATSGICDEPTITVTGNAEILINPDQVVITASVESRAPTVSAATKDNDTKVHAIVDFLKKSGVDDKHLRTEYISIEPIMRTARGYSKSYSQQANAQAANNDDLFGGTAEESERPVGYLASRQFAITVADLKTFESIYKGLIEQGINRVRGIEYRTSELRKHRDKARLDAVRAAREKAEAMAGELGVKVAAVKTIRETTNDYYDRMSQNRSSNFIGESPSSETAFAAGNISIFASVEVVFILGNTELKR